MNPGFRVGDVVVVTENIDRRQTKGQKATIIGEPSRVYGHHSQPINDEENLFIPDVTYSYRVSFENNNRTPDGQRGNWVIIERYLKPFEIPVVYNEEEWV